MPKGGTIKLNTRAMQTNTAGRTIYNQGVGGKRNRRRRTRVRKKATGQGPVSPASLSDQPSLECAQGAAPPRHSWQVGRNGD